jgi:CheY-like chemotaxis protein
VEDSGRGVDPMVREHLFEPFVTTKGQRGTGLGLGIAKSFAVAHDGSLELARSGETGSVFQLSLPPRTEAPPQPSEPHELRDTGELPVLAERPRVLVVDDEPAIARAMGRWLGRIAAIESTTDPEAALELAVGNDFDLILCDLNMPDMSGMDLLAALRERRPDAAAKVVIMTGAIDADLGPDVRVLAKPPDPDDIRGLLTSSSSPEPVRRTAT